MFKAFESKLFHLEFEFRVLKKAEIQIVVTTHWCSPGIPDLPFTFRLYRNLRFVLLVHDESA